MINFDQSHDQAENRFAKNNENLLNDFFGTTDITSLWIADMDFEIAEPITSELARVVKRGVYSYEFAPDEMFTSISAWFKRKHDLTLNAERFLQVPSVLTGIALLIRKFTNEGDGVLIQTPVYHQFEAIIKKANREIIANPLVNRNGYYTMDLNDLKSKFESGKVKAMILCNPHNPVGRVWKKAELQHVLDLADEYNVMVISDEIHADITYTGHQYCSFMYLNADKHAALIGSTAKTFGMHSISNGFVYVPSTKNYNLLKQDVLGMFLNHGSSLTTFATIAAYQKGEPWLNNLLVYLESIIDWIREFIKDEMPLLKLSPVEGTYQIWLDFSAYGLADDELVNKIVQQAKLGLAPGNWFDKSGKHNQFMRINIASPKSKIQDAFYRLKEALN